MEYDKYSSLTNDRFGGIWNCIAPPEFQETDHTIRVPPIYNKFDSIDLILIHIFKGYLGMGNKYDVIIHYMNGIIFELMALVSNNLEIYFWIKQFVVKINVIKSMKCLNYVQFTDYIYPINWLSIYDMTHLLYGLLYGSLWFNLYLASIEKYPECADCNNNNTYWEY